MGLDLVLATALTAINRHQLALAAIKLLVLAHFPLVVVIQAQGLTLMLVRQLWLFKREYVAHLEFSAVA